jgi:hypothetical protein
MSKTNDISSLISIDQLVTQYLPVSKKKARRFIHAYLEPKYVGNRIFVERAALERLLNDPNREKFPLNF